MNVVEPLTVASSRPGPKLGPKPGDGFNLIGLTRPELVAAMAELDVPERQRKMRVQQLWRWFYNRGVNNFDEMSDLGKDLRKHLAENHSIARPAITTRLDSTDGTIKWLLRLVDGNEIEMVYIPDLDHGALCISSQVGCTLNCDFCHTGTMPLVRNLTPEEILGQFMLARDCLNDWPQQSEGPRENARIISTIVMMGMGEPLLNYDNVAKALNIIMDGEGIALSRRAITLSTAGLVPAMERCGRELRVNLAVSLHAVNDEVRNKLVPLNRRHPIAELIQACHDYPSANNARRITFEYVMLQKINDSLEDAHELVRLLRGLPAKINLIPFNPWPGSSYECSSNNRIHRFAAVLNDAGFAAPIRTPRGRDIMAACGQLKSDSEKKKRSLKP
ncbi:MAG: 23S rRNA (adenine(2503)-C(2))-methyltransferase RlmN [Rhodospirillaceae bacterium]|nr:23S rRNA (adenine(2503)-C(2))-methyltransferase RlmN [Rhodospirillaceae bacterium]MBT4045635.1 23S rRNA (adenine(2503)-C(2))-methyltransferase RlmN [Rhodospirillaceae bacterium]MBT4689542.1 23S rRNA (adenine(2503)-C(2))-methyltransferase RlmN [Rhodospirillaceae bacterium]MBT5080394.1 23S rRNA (adenine(2503)-C(2))-methyltransferase RlmN [Rhodospirillaceae bacterium]MBT5522752.1 23S rRNA (adenine(2503)-C(2))-methyltransferase RlmN [Rhodospirillaceae bacterium]